MKSVINIIDVDTGSRSAMEQHAGESSFNFYIFSNA